MQNALLTDLASEQFLDEQLATTESMSRYMQLDGWIFEVKSIKAKRTKNQGKSIDAMANLCVNGAHANVDSFMSLDGEKMSPADLLAFKTLFQQLDIDDIRYDD